MLDVEQQIQRLADAAFEATSPVAHSPSSAHQTRSRSRPSAIAAAVLVAVVGVGGLIAVTQTRDDSAADLPRFEITDVAAIDLDDAVETSDRERIGAIGPLLTFEFDQLPPGWSADVNFTTTTGFGGEPGNGYWQQVAVTTPDRVGLIVNIEGQLDATAPPLATSSREADGEAVDVRGQPGVKVAGQLMWVEQNQAVITILSRTAVSWGDVHEAMIELADLLQPTIIDLEWAGETGTLPRLSDAEMLLGGTLGGTKWKLVTTPAGIALATGPELSTTNTGLPLGTDANTIDYSIRSVSIPGGAVIHGDAPADIDRTLLRTRTSTIDIPTAPPIANRRPFAVPIDDRLDPVALEFLDNNGNVLATIDLDSLPPYLGGALRTSVPVTRP